MSRSRDMLLRARWIVVDPSRVLRDAALRVRGGRVLEVLEGAGAIARARSGAVVHDCGTCTVAAGMVNAHAHLELGALAGRTPRGPNFAEWVRNVVALRAAEARSRLIDAAREGAELALASGTTSIVDVDTTGAAIEALAGHPLRVIHMREVLDAHDPQRTAAAVARIERGLPRRVRQTEGLSPHAPFTVSPALLRKVGEIARRRHLPVQMHWSETRAEVEWMAAGTGPLRGLLGSSPLRSGLDLLEEARLLGPGLSLVHGNHAQAGEPERLAASGVTLVHCPGSHAWFQREPFDGERFLRAGVRLALGTDSLASNESLDLRRELRRFAAGRPQVRPAALWDLVTSAGAAAVGREAELGTLAPGARADWLVFDGPSGSAEEALAALCADERAPREVWVAGRRVR